jgi:hypothetical protein
MTPGPTDTDRGTVKVLAIIGYTRSGSTLLDGMLGELDGFFSTGELHYLWERGLLEGRHCGCGRRVTDCEVWSRVLPEVFDGSPPDARRVVELQRHTVRTRHTWPLLRGRATPFGDDRALTAYRGIATRLYRAIAEVAGARVVVDSSKRPSDGAVLRLLPGIDPYFVHLVRDPRAIVFSWRRRKREVDTGTETAMPRQPLLQSIGGWLELNLAADAVRKAAGPSRSMLLRYEDLMDQPRSWIARIATMLAEPVEPNPFLDDHTVRLGPNHTVAGNPGRFTRGPVELRADVEWMSAMARRDRMLTTALTAPLLRRYGYSVEGGPARAGGA